jgi:hypothetical protein
MLPLIPAWHLLQPLEPISSPASQGAYDAQYLKYELRHLLFELFI